MRMNGDMLDTNVIIKYLAGDESAKRLDVWIAATAKSRRCRLLTYDAHFKSVGGLNVAS